MNNRSSFRHRALLLFACFTFLGIAARSNANGVLSGVVSNSAAKTNLEGALVSIPELGRAERTDWAGRYMLGNLPVGTHAVVVSYTGLDTMRQTVEIVSGRSAALDFNLTSEVYRLEAFTVAGEREGNAVAVTKQQNAENLTNIVAIDLYGNVADSNIGNFLKRMPGVAGVGEGGDVTGLSIRGAPRSWNAINVDGVRSSAAYSGTDSNVGRSIVTDQLSSEFVKEVELVKGLRPDMPADSVGGTVNLVTKSALDVKGRRFTWRAGGTYNAYRPEIGNIYPSAAFTFMDRLGNNDSLGLALTGSYGVVRNARDRLQMGVAANGINNQARTLDDDYTRLRSSGAAKLNFRVRPELELWAGLQYSYYSTQQERSDWNIVPSSTNIADYAVVSRAQIEAGTPPRTTTNQPAGIAPDPSPAFTEFLHANFTNTKGGLTRHARNYKFDVGGELRLPADQKLKMVLAYSPSEYRFILQNIAAARTGGFGEVFDAREDRNFPKYVQSYGSTIAAGSNLDDYTALLAVNDRYSEETMAYGSLDYTKTFAGQRVKTDLSAGVSWRSQNRTLQTYTPTWDYVGADGVAGRNAATGRNDDNLAQFLNPEPGYGVFKNRYPQRDDFDYPKFQRYHAENPGSFRPRATVAAAPVYNEITEDVTALYAMATSRFKALTVLAGARFEDTRVDALGTLTDPRNPSVTTTRQGGEYDIVTPSVHLKYEIRKDLIARASYSSGLTRPNFDRLYPNTTVSYDSSTGLGTVIQNDPALGPQYSDNYDVSLEYYLNPAGILSVGYFRKNVTDFIAQEVQEIEPGEDNGFGGEYAGFNLITTRNYGDARIEGFEVNYSQQLRRLPRPFNTLTVNANWTELESEGYYGNSPTADELVEFIPRTTNAGASWVLGRFTLRVQYNFQGAFLNSYNTLPSLRIYSTRNETWDAGALVKLNDKFGLYLDVTNIFNKEPSWYRGGDHSRVVMNEVFGTRIAAGVTGRF